MDTGGGGSETSASEFSTASSAGTVSVPRSNSVAVPNTDASAKAFLAAFESPACILERPSAGASPRRSQLEPVWTNARWDALASGRSLVEMLDTDGLRQFGAWIRSKERDDERGWQRRASGIKRQRLSPPNTDTDVRMAEPDEPGGASLSREQVDSPLESLFGTSHLVLRLSQPNVTLEFVQTPYAPVTSGGVASMLTPAISAITTDDYVAHASSTQPASSTSYVAVQTLLRPTVATKPPRSNGRASPIALTSHTRARDTGMPSNGSMNSTESTSTDTAMSATTTALGAGIRRPTGNTPLEYYERARSDGSSSSAQQRRNTARGLAATIGGGAGPDSGASLDTSTATLQIRPQTDYFSSAHGKPPTPLRSAESFRLVPYDQDSRDPLSIDYLLDHTDWANHPLGPRADWPIPLRTALSMILGTKQQAALWWGREDKFMLYNTAYSQNVSKKHPFIFGKRGAEAWAEVWDELGPISEEVVGGNAKSADNEMFLFRTEEGDELEEQYHSWNWSPIWSEPFDKDPPPGIKPEVLGLLNTTKNTTIEVKAERRSRVLRDLRDLCGSTRELHDFDRAIVEGLSREPKDLPYMLWYHVQLEENNSSCKSSKNEGDERSMGSGRSLTSVKLKLGGSIGAIDPEQDIVIDFNKAAKAYNIEPETPEESDGDVDTRPVQRWPFREALATREKVLVERARRFTNGWQPRSWDMLPTRAVVVPICVESDEAVPYGVLVIGLNPRAPFDADYEAFVHSIGLQVYSGIIQMKADQVQRLEERAEEAEHRRSVAEEERRQQELLIDVTSHEIRNPLSAMINCAQIVRGNLAVLRNHFASAVDQQTPFIPSAELVSQIDEDCDALESIHACSITLESISTDILALGRMQLDMLTFNHVDTNLTSVAGKIMSIYSHECRMNDITLTLDLDPSVSKFDWIKTDPTRLHQIIGNLVSNSLKFSAGRPIRKVDLSISLAFEPPTSTASCLPPMPNRLPDTAQEGQTCYIYVAVTDSGPGLKKEDLLLLFRRFSQASNVPTKVFGGSGLGLFVCRKIAEQMGGRIEVDSEFGVGSTFRFFITAQIGQPATRVSISEASAGEINKPRRPPSVLIVEDNPINQKVLARQIKAAKMTCDVANNGLEALQKIRAVASIDAQGQAVGKLFDVCLMDLEMPVMGGLAAIRQIREEELMGRLHRSTVWALTGNARQAQIDEAMSQGMDMVWIKPYKIEDLVAKIEAHVEGMSMQQ